MDAPAPLIDTIAGLRCTLCRAGGLLTHLDHVACGVCGQSYPVLGGVPIMFESATVEPGPAVDEAAAREVLDAFGIQADALSVLRMRTAMRRRVRFGDALIETESQQFLDRVRASGHAISAAPAEALVEIPAGLVGEQRYHWAKTYLPRRMQGGVRFLANMRLENRGPAALRSAGAGRAHVAIRWARQDRSDLGEQSERTPLPIDLAPGQAVTVAVWVVPPPEPGAYRLTVLIVREQLDWLEQDAITLPVTVSDAAPPPTPDGWRVLPDAPSSYDADHDRGCALLEGWVRDHAPTRPRALEVGGNAAPMLARMESLLGPDPVNADVDLLGLQVGRMVARQHGSAVRPLCADAFHLPFSSGWFDVIVIFASLHHFPDPAALLDHLRRKLRPGGFIGLLCEPVGHPWPGALTQDFLTELRRGVNEQSFSLREYDMMFRQAELVAEEVIVDGNSLKARLVHAPADQAP